MVVEQLTRPDYSSSTKLNSYNKCFGAPDKIVEVGDKFQVELPPLSSTYRADSRHNVFIRMPIPVKWISHGHDIRSQEARYLLAPEVCSKPWSDAEKASFLLGLYIFLKNLVDVRRFVESKDMNAILSYYYGEFHGSPEYHRWSDCRKRKTRRCVIGQKIFCGPREQELLSRILPSVPDDCQVALLKVSKRYGDQKVSLSHYVSSLKAMVGRDKLVEVAGIGNGTRDLIGRTFECWKSNQSIPVHPEVPTEKACSSLTASQIINILRGDCRLSKARSNKLFWEAVWPRLLARGWNSVEPSGLKNSFVFLAPGVKNFSRRKLEKGVQYFDSVADVLRRVTNEPGLVELDAEEDNGENKKEESTDQISAREPNNDGDDNDDGDVDLSSRQRRCHLQPQRPKRSSNTVQFTVVDTSSSGGRIRELRELPVESLNSSTPQNHLESSYKNASEEITDTPETTKSCPEISEKSVGKMKRKVEFHEKKQSKKVAKSLSVEKVKRGGADFKTPIITRRDARLTTGNREGNDIGTSWSLPISRLENGMSSCCSSLQETSASLPSQTETPESLPSQTGSYQGKLSPSTSSIKNSLSENAQGAPSSNIPALESFNRAEPGLLLDLNEPLVFPEPENQTTQQDAEPRLWLDLNEPPVSPEPENQTTQQDAVPRLWLDLNEPPVSPEPQNQTTEQDEHHLPNNFLSNEAGSEQQDTDHSVPSSSTSDARPRPEPELIVNPQWHSTRSRPPTTRVLEALANGYLTVNRRRKTKDGERASRSSQRARVAVESIHSTMAYQTEEVKNDASNSSGESKLACNSEANPGAANEESVSAPGIGNMSS